MIEILFNIFFFLSGLFPVLSRSPDSELRRQAVSFYQFLLGTKKIHTLQGVYAYLTTSFKASVVDDGDPARVFFILDVLSNLIRGKGSVLSKWALEPSIFALLDGFVSDPHLTKRAPHIHYALVQTMARHCIAHNQFAASSRYEAKLINLSCSHNPCNIFFYNFQTCSIWKTIVCIGSLCYAL